MHPPLDRPHPDCQQAIDALRSCHESTPKFNFWNPGKCNELKATLDQCFSEEKQRMLADMNKDFQQRRLEEDEEAAKSTGTNMSFGEFLKKDRAYQNEMHRIQKDKETTSWFGFSK